MRSGAGIDRRGRSRQATGLLAVGTAPCADGLIASNTSTIPIAQLAAKLADPRRFCGLHFFHPVGKRPLVEVIRGPRTSDEAVAIAAGFGRAVGKLPLLVGDGPGFLVNRLLVPYLTEGLELLLDGATMIRSNPRPRLSAWRWVLCGCWTRLGWDTA